MALARIISRSLECSHALAASLEERGYAVEIVSPDDIPAHPADLELRVETSPDNVLTARVHAKNGPRSASLDFVHYVNPPMPDFRRKLPEALERPLCPPSSALGAVPIAGTKADAASPASIPEPAGLASEESAVAAPEALAPPSVDPIPKPIVVETGAIETAETAALPEHVRQPARSWPRVKIVITRAHPDSATSDSLKRKPEPILRPIDRRASWQPRVAATAAILLLTASLLTMRAMRPRGVIASKRQVAAPAALVTPDPIQPGQPQNAQPQGAQQQTGQPPTDQVRTGDDGSLSAHLSTSADSPSGAPAIDHSVVPATEADKLKGEKSPSAASGVSAASSVKHATSKPPRRQRARRPDVVAPNTITYFNTPGAKPIVVKPLPQHPVRSQKRESAVAARSVAVLNPASGPIAAPDK